MLTGVFWGTACVYVEGGRIPDLPYLGICGALTELPLVASFIAG